MGAFLQGFLVYNYVHRCPQDTPASQFAKGDNPKVARLDQESKVRALHDAVARGAAVS